MEAQDRVTCPAILHLDLTTRAHPNEQPTHPPSPGLSASPRLGGVDANQPRAEDWAYVFVLAGAGFPRSELCARRAVTAVTKSLGVRSDQTEVSTPGGIYKTSLTWLIR